MKKYLVIPILTLAACAGNSNSDNKTTASTDTAQAATPTTNKEYCFLRTEGAKDQDSTNIHITIVDNKVSGEMSWIPKEKDRRKGTLTGTLAGDEIKAVWTFMQEGVTDSMDLALKLSPNQLAQKPLKTNPATGRQETDPSADYTILFKPSDCPAH